MSSPFIQIEEYLVSRFADLQSEIDTLKARVNVLTDLGPAVQPFVTVTTAVPLVVAEAKPRKARAKPPVATVPAVLLSDDEVQVAASAPGPTVVNSVKELAVALIPPSIAPAPITRIVTGGELIAAVQLFRATHGIEAARAMWARIAPGKNKISEVTDAERPSILDAVNAESAHAAK